MAANESGSDIASQMNGLVGGHAHESVRDWCIDRVAYLGRKLCASCELRSTHVCQHVHSGRELICLVRAKFDHQADTTHHIR